MAALHLSGATTVADLKKQFNEAFGSQIRVYAGNKVAELTATLSSIGLTKDGDFECVNSMTVASFAEQIKADFGIKVKVYTCDEWVAVLGELTLEMSGKVKKNAVKADMEKLLDPNAQAAAKAVSEEKTKAEMPKTEKPKEEATPNTTAKADDKTKEMEDEIKRLKAELAKAKSEEKTKAEKPAKKSNDPFDGLMVEVCAGMYWQKYDYGECIQPADKRKNSYWASSVGSRLVTITKSFYICKYAVTQGQWKAIMGEGFNPSKFRGDDNLPVESFTFKEMYDFIDKLNKRTGKKYRLPTEAEWQWAASGAVNDDDLGDWPGCKDESELDKYAWFSLNSGNKTHPVGQKKPNELGLYDMSGNLWEICEDGYKQYSNHKLGTSAVTDPCFKSDYEWRIIKGGSFDKKAVSCKISGYNNASSASDNRPLSSFRLALTKE